MSTNRCMIALRVAGMTVKGGETIIDEMNLNTGITAKGAWRVLPDEFADKTVVNGKLFYDDYKSSQNCVVREYSFILVTPLMTTRDRSIMEQAVAVMNRIYEEGGLLISPRSIELYFIGAYSGVKAKKIARRIVPRNRLIYLMFLQYFSPFWAQDGDTSGDESGERDRSLADSMACNPDMTRGLIRDIVALLCADDNMVPDENSGKYKSRFDRDSSPDSEKNY